ncbi:MAG: 16S rRNA (guanine(966)-N(2))-methyltransferase RsmD [Chloroflexi bacterium]|nr:16S rRNA (guanine(966)-N(2))-methyltransferase RsmD [Chloroflexota bacterium]
MRVIAGQAKGHHLKAPKGLSTRPMADKIKGAVFSVLETQGAHFGRVLDLYAGTGSLGIEALSRGADYADFVEQTQSVCRIIEENLEHTKFRAQAKVHCRKVAQFLSSVDKDGTLSLYDLVFMDPPYADPQIVNTIVSLARAGVLADGGFLVVGHSPRVVLADQYEELHRVKWRCHGDSCFSIYRFQEPAA